MLSRHFLRAKALQTIYAGVTAKSTSEDELLKMFDYNVGRLNDLGLLQLSTLPQLTFTAERVYENETQKFNPNPTELELLHRWAQNPFVDRLSQGFEYRNIVNRMRIDWSNHFDVFRKVLNVFKSSRQYLDFIAISKPTFDDERAIAVNAFKYLMNDETLLITSLALCFGMVVAASEAGFSAAFGAFVMGSILAETVEAEQIEHLVVPVKNLFGAIFFVSVGMMVDVNLIIEYIVPILSIIAAIMLGQTILSTCGFLLSGQSLKTSMQCSFSLTQIGEFAFILATLGTSLKVTSDFLYPIVVAVSVFTTFTTPYMIRLAEPAYNALARVLPAKWIAKLERNKDEDDDKAPDEIQEIWNENFKKFVFIILINSVLCVAIMALMYYYGQPIIEGIVPEKWVHPVTALIALILCSPFLWMLLRGGGDNSEIDMLWESGPRWRVRITACSLLRLLLTAVFVSYFVDYAIPWSTWLAMFALVAILFIIYYSSHLEKQSKKMARNFTENLSAREKMKNEEP